MAWCHMKMSLWLLLRCGRTARDKHLTRSLWQIAERRKRRRVREILRREPSGESQWARPRIEGRSILGRVFSVAFA